MPLIDSLASYRTSINEANTFIEIAFRRNRSRRFILPANERDFITDSAFLKIYIAWESFLENCFIKYMLGEPSIHGNIIIRYVQPLDYQHANNLLIGTQKYVDWSNPEIIRKLSSLYFAPGNPIETYISSLSADLFDLKTIRNAAAHLSTTTSAQLDSLGTRILKRTCVALKVSDLIFSLDPTSTTGDTLLTTYLNKLDITAEGIANG